MTDLTSSPLSRRQAFQLGAGVALAGLAVGKSSAAVPEPLTIIDCHTHFFDPTRPEGIPWPGKDSPLYGRTLPADYRAIKLNPPVRGTVVVEASPWLEDNQWILDLAENDPFIVGLIGHLSPGEAEFEKHLARFAKNKLFRGIRVSGGAISKGLENPQFVRDIALLGERGLTLDLNGGGAQLDDMARLAVAVPKVKIVINHLAGGRIDGKEPHPEWLARIKTLAKHEQVAMKVSGLGDNTGLRDKTAPRDVAFYSPVLSAVWEAFGPDRLIYGSNWPVSEQYASLETLQGVTLEYFTGHGQAALRKLCADNARTFYGWVERK